MWGNPAPVSETAKAEFVLRQEHEKRGLEQIRANKKKIKSEGAFLSWMILEVITDSPNILTAAITALLVCS